MANRLSAADTSPAHPHSTHAGCPQLPRGDLWVFGYGSLMWNPGFAYQHSAPALLRGYHRAFCVHSVRYRGTPECPGLVFGLDRGGACRGIAFRIAKENVNGVLEYLWAREMPQFAYRPRLVPIEVDAVRILALTFLANNGHASYAGRLEIDHIAHTIAKCSGANGPNVDYLANTLSHLDALGIREPHLHRLMLAVQAALADRR